MKLKPLFIPAACVGLGLALLPLYISRLSAGTVPTGDNGAGTIHADGTNSADSQGDGGTVTANPLTWRGTATGGASSDESTAVDGVNHDFFVLHVAGNPSDYNGKNIVVTIDWLNPADDYDLHVHQGSETGPEVATSANGAPSTEEKISIDPNATGVGDYFINAVYFTVPDASADHYTGKAVISTPVVLRTATYIKGAATGLQFSPNTPLKAPTGGRAGEPSSNIDKFGNYYIAGIRGVPAGVDLWYLDLRPTLSATGGTDPSSAVAVALNKKGKPKKVKAKKGAQANATPTPNPSFDPLMRNPLYRGQPDSPTTTGGVPTVQAGALGGGDVSLAVGFGPYSGLDAPAGQADPTLVFTSLTAANVTVTRSLDRGQTFQQNGAGNAAGGVPVNDRQWTEAFGPNTVYLEYRNFGAGVAFMQRSTDGGLTYANATPIGTIPQTGSIDVDQFDGTIYVGGNDGSVTTVTPLLGPGGTPGTFVKHQATAATNVANIFFVTRVANDHRDGSGNLNHFGTVYSCYSDGQNIFLVHSTDQGATWSNPVAVNDPNDPTTKVNLLPWMKPGKTPGSVGVCWYGTDNNANNDSARWRVYYAQSFNAMAASPTFRIVEAGDHVNHAANISLSGLAVGGESPNRNLIDYFQLDYDQNGAAILGYTDDHNDFDGQVYVTHQIAGPGIDSGGSSNVPTPNPNAPLQARSAEPISPPAQPGPNGEQVTDFLHDQDSGLLGVTPTDNPVDIVSVKYISADNNTGPVITATMKVSSLTVIPPSTTWRMYFTANAPDAGTGLINVSSGNGYREGHRIAAISSSSRPRPMLPGTPLLLNGARLSGTLTGARPVRSKGLLIAGFSIRPRRPSLLLSRRRSLILIWTAFTLTTPPFIFTRAQCSVDCVRLPSTLHLVAT